MHRFERTTLKDATTTLFDLTIPVRFQDVDAAGVVFFARFFDYAHDTYAAFLAHVGVDLPRVLADGTWAAPLRHAECDFLGPLRFGDVVQVALVCAHLAESEITLGFRLSLPGSRTVALVQTVHTFISPGTRSRIPVPGPLLAALDPIRA